ncbi:MAG: metallophosphoesterase [Thermoguttaceae bacterium]|nr:metallophosphoesterase [Thermoguttaceae bacterium]
MKRRDFLRMTAAAMFAAAASPWSISLADDLTDLLDSTDDSVPRDMNIVAFFSDTHVRVPETQPEPQRLLKCIKAVLNMNPRPATLLCYGDMAFFEGKVEEYQLFKKLMAPIDKAGIKWETTMGNHDRLNNFFEAFPERKEKKPAVKDRYVHIVRTHRADFILLDSYMEGQVRGEIRRDQRDWLIDKLKEYKVATKPVFVGCHHLLNETNLTDTLLEYPVCPGYIHGHAHKWMVETVKGLPSLGFAATGPWGDLGYAVANLTATEATFVPFVDTYLTPSWSKTKMDAQAMEAYLKKIEEQTLVMPFRR